MKPLAKIMSIGFLCLAYTSPSYASCDPLLNYEAKRLHSSKSVDFCQAFEGKTLLIVNTASRCGFTPQLSQLEALYQKYKDEGLEIVGFPSNSFRQELATEAETASVCFKNFGVSFTMLAPSDVKGPEQNEFYKMLEQRTAKSPNWNFNKFLISSDLSSISLFRSQVTPLDSVLEDAIKRSLN
jgi:glutathione peroxidase